MTNLQTKIQFINAIEKGMNELAEIKGMTVTSIGRLLGVGSETSYHRISTIAVKGMGPKKINEFEVDEYEATLRLVATTILKEQGAI